MNQTNVIPETLPWYHYGIVWLVVLLPVAVVVASMATFYIAHQNAPQISSPAVAGQQD